jgi:2-dehydropantoate 2-reductase
MNYGRLIRAPYVVETMRNTYEESVAVAKAANIELPADLWESLLQISDNMAEQRSSTAQDLARGKPTEIDHLNGFIVRQGKELGVATPVNQTLVCLVKLLEESHLHERAGS